jgi:hypothetical protein
MSVWQMAGLPKFWRIGKIPVDKLVGKARIWRCWRVWFKDLPKFGEIWSFSSVSVQ